MKTPIALTAIAVIAIAGTGCGSDDSTTVDATLTQAAAQPAQTVTSPTTDTSATDPPATDPPTTDPPTTTEVITVNGFSRDAATVVSDAIKAATDARDTDAFVGALGPGGEYVAIDGQSYVGDALADLLTAAWANINSYDGFDTLKPTPTGFIAVGSETTVDGDVNALGFEYRQNTQGGYRMIAIEPVLLGATLDSAADSGLSATEAATILDQIVGTFADRDWTPAEEALGADGAWVEPEGEYGADEVGAFFDTFPGIDHIERTGGGAPSLGGFAFPVTDFNADGTTGDYYMVVTRNKTGALRLIYQPSLAVDTPAD